MRFMIMLAAVSGTVMLTSPESFAASSPARWCLMGAGGTNAGECVYRNLEQCVQDRIGEGGNCAPNPNGPLADR
jgi:hypothetical protein